MIQEPKFLRELVPAKPGQKMQSTQDKIGPYNLQTSACTALADVELARQRLLLAEHAWSDASRGDWPASCERGQVSYSLDEIVKMGASVYRRYFTQQFKRSALPNI